MRIELDCTEGLEWGIVNFVGVGIRTALHSAGNKHCSGAYGIGIEPAEQVARGVTDKSGL